MLDRDAIGRRRLLAVVGTRPEAIKIAPLMLAARAHPRLSLRTLATGQHGAPFHTALADFGLSADLHLAPVATDPSPGTMVARLAVALKPVIAADAPDMVLVQGDTTSAYAGALAAHGLGIPIGHVEAGLRSFDLARPWPEERNRVGIDRLATLLFAPTVGAVANLAHDPDVTGKILLTGNTGIDALLAMRARLPAMPPARAGTPALILLTCHRRESIGRGIDDICTAALALADRGDIHILCPVHGNRAVGDTVRARLADHPAITLSAGLSYRDMVAAMSAARLILTDSGGIQEEAPALGVPTLVLRDATERPEGQATGNLALVGTDPRRIVALANRLLDDPRAHARMARPAFPFGDGAAAVRILDAVHAYLAAPAGPRPSLPSAPVSIMDGAREGA